MFRSKSLWDTAAIVSWSSYDVDFDDFLTWNPYLGMEVGMTRQIRDLAKAPEGQPTKNMLEPATERMSIDQMIVGYTINGAIQLGIDATKGSIEVGKDADFLAFDHDLMAEDHEGFSQNMPRDVYFSGVRMNRAGTPSNLGASQTRQHETDERRHLPQREALPSCASGRSRGGRGPMFRQTHAGPALAT